jgi:hypothetical protein
MHNAGCSNSLSACEGELCQAAPSDRICRRHFHAVYFEIIVRRAVLARMKPSEASCIDENSFVHCPHTIQHRSKAITTIRFNMLIMQFFTLLQIANSCNIPVTGAARNLQRHEFEVDHSCRPTEDHQDFSDSLSAAMHLRGGTLSREGFSLTEHSRALAVSFAPSTRLSGRCTPAVRETAFRPPLRASSSDPVLRKYRDSRAAARMQHGRPPKLSRSVEVNH